MKIGIKLLLLLTGALLYGMLNNGTGGQTNCKDTIDANSTWDTTKGVEARGTIDGIFTREIVEGAKPGS